jgi:hypothetical protein
MLASRWTLPCRSIGRFEEFVSRETSHLAKSGESTRAWHITPFVICLVPHEHTQRMSDPHQPPSTSWYHLALYDTSFVPVFLVVSVINFCLRRSNEPFNRKITMVRVYFRRLSAFEPRGNQRFICTCQSCTRATDTSIRGVTCHACHGSYPSHKRVRCNNKCELTPLSPYFHCALSHRYVRPLLRPSKF